MKYFRDIFEGIWTAIVGLGITIKYLFTPSVTVQYPDERIAVSPNFRGRFHLKLDKCTGCQACARACPVDCILIETKRGEDKKLKILKFDVDVTKCMFCGLCVEACPVASLEMGQEYELSCYSRKDMIYSLDKEYLEKESEKVAPKGDSPPSGEVT